MTVADARVAAARHAVTDPVERELAEGRGVDLDVVVGLLAAYDEVGRCGGAMPRLLDGAPMFCRLPHGHAGWHKCDDGAEWSQTADNETGGAPARTAGKDPSNKAEGGKQ